MCRVSESGRQQVNRGERVHPRAHACVIIPVKGSIRGWCYRKYLFKSRSP